MLDVVPPGIDRSDEKRRGARIIEIGVPGGRGRLRKMQIRARGRRPRFRVKPLENPLRIDVQIVGIGPDEARGVDVPRKVGEPALLDRPEIRLADAQGDSYAGELLADLEPGVAQARADADIAVRIAVARDLRHGSIRWHVRHTPGAPAFSAVAASYRLGPER